MNGNYLSGLQNPIEYPPLNTHYSTSQKFRYPRKGSQKLDPQTYEHKKYQSSYKKALDKEFQEVSRKQAGKENFIDNGLKKPRKSAFKGQKAYEYYLPEDNSLSKLRAMSKSKKSALVDDQQRVQFKGCEMSEVQSNLYQELQYCKLVGSLQEQKRQLLEKENSDSKAEIAELKKVIEKYKYKNSRLKHELNKLYLQLTNSESENFQKEVIKKKFHHQHQYSQEKVIKNIAQQRVSDSNSSENDDGFFSGHFLDDSKVADEGNQKTESEKRDFLNSRSHKKRKSRSNKTENAVSSFVTEKKAHQKQLDSMKKCSVCDKLNKRMESERQLYEKDRNFLRDQLEVIEDALEEEKRKAKKQEYSRSQIAAELTATNGEVTQCYRLIEDQSKLIDELESKLKSLERKQNLSQKTRGEENRPSQSKMNRNSNPHLNSYLHQKFDSNLGGRYHPSTLEERPVQLFRTHHYRRGEVPAANMKSPEKLNFNDNLEARNKRVQNASFVWDGRVRLNNTVDIIGHSLRDSRAQLQEHSQLPEKQRARVISDGQKRRCGSIKNVRQ